MSEVNRNEGNENTEHDATNDDESGAMLSNFDWALNGSSESQEDKSTSARDGSESSDDSADGGKGDSDPESTLPLSAVETPESSTRSEETTVVSAADSPAQVISDATSTETLASPINATTPLPAAAPINATAMMPPAIPPNDQDAQGNDGNNVGGGSPDPRGKNHKRTVIIASVIAAVVVIALAIGGIMWWNTRAHSNALAACTENVQGFQNAKTQWDEAVAASAETAKITEDQVADASTVSSLKDALAGTVPTVGECSASASAQELQQVASSAKASADKLADSTDNVSRLAKKVEASQAQKAADEAASGLQQAIDSAKELLNSEEAKQIEQSLVSGLQTAVDAANEALSQKQSADLLQKATSVLNDAVQKVKDAIAAYQQSPAVLAAQYCPAAAGGYESDPTRGPETTATFSVENGCEFMQQGQYYSFVKDSMKKNADGSVTWSVTFDANRSDSSDGGFGYTSATLYPPQVGGAGELSHATQYYRLSMNSTRFGAVIGWKVNQ